MGGILDLLIISISLLIEYAVIKFTVLKKVREQKLEEIDKEYKKQREKLREEQREYEQLYAGKRLDLEKDYNEWFKTYKNSKEYFEQQLELLKNSIEKINCQINDEIKNRDELAPYCLSFTEEELSDIEYLLDIKNTLIKKDIIPKLIWSNYIINAFNTMYKRQFGSKNPKNAIYLIENLDSKEKYIGRTVNIHDRWAEHIKTSLGITGTKSALHSSMYDNWDRFSFRVLEENLSTEQMKEREKYYIDFYQSNIYGYNQNKGG